MIVLQAKGLGYAINTEEELNFVKEIAEATGVILDPVYRYNKVIEAILEYRVVPTSSSVVV